MDVARHVRSKRGAHLEEQLKQRNAQQRVCGVVTQALLKSRARNRLTATRDGHRCETQPDDGV